MALKGIRVVEMAGLAPAPFCGMILADFGAQVIRVDRISSGTLDMDRLMRGKRSIAIDLKRKDGIGILKRLCERSDVFIEPFRPGVAEKLNIGPDQLLKLNPKLIYARLTGFGQNGPYSNMAGHDINYVAISGILGSLGRQHEKPTAPLNLLADFAGGGLMCAFGIVMALFERVKSGRGQVIDASMVEGIAYLSSWIFKTRDSKFIWSGPRGTNLLDSGTPIYDTYETKDGLYVAVGALEPQFQATLFEKLGLNFNASDSFQQPNVVRKALEETFKTRTRAEWENLFDGSDACVTPVLDLNDVAQHKHNIDRKSFRKCSDNAQPYEPKPAPKLDRTPADPDYTRNPSAGENSEEILRELGYTNAEIEQFLANGFVLQAKLDVNPGSKL